MNNFKDQINYIKSVKKLEHKRFINHPLYKILNIDKINQSQEYQNLLGGGVIKNQIPKKFIDLCFPLAKSFNNYIKTITKENFDINVPSYIMGFLKRDIEQYKQNVNNKEKLLSYKINGMSKYEYCHMYYLCLLYHKELGLPKFITLYQKNNSVESNQKDLLFQGFIQSRIHYIITGKHLPILAFDTIAKHAICHCFIPNDKTGRWSHILIDSDGPNVNQGPIFVNQEYKNDLQLTKTKIKKSWKRYIQTLEYQKNPEFLDTLECVENIQGDYSTCVLWSFGISIHILRHYENVYNNITPEKLQNWCKQMSIRTLQSTHTSNNSIMSLAETDYFKDLLHETVSLFHYYLYVFVFKHFNRVYQQNIELTDNHELSQHRAQKDIFKIYKLTKSEKKQKIHDHFIKVIKGLLDKWNLFNFVSI